jgi:hypothetical protein
MTPPAHHLLPPPRPVPPGLTFHYSDLAPALWAITCTALALFCAWVVVFYPQRGDAQAGTMLVGGGFGVFAAIFTAWWWVRIRRRRRVFTHGAAMQGRRIADRVFEIRTRQHGAHLVTTANARIVFDDNKTLSVSLLRANPSAEPIVYVLGRWAAIYEPGSIVFDTWH